MEKQNLIHAIATKFQNVQSVLHERGLRIWAATEAQQIGWGGETVVAQATGMSRTTIRRGMLEINTNQVETLDKLRSRLPGGGRKKITEHYPDIKHDLDTLIDPLMRGDPESPLRWTCKSTRRLADELNRQNYDVCPTTVRELLSEMEYSLQGNQKTREGADHPDRNEQFLHIYQTHQKVP